MVLTRTPPAVTTASPRSPSRVVVHSTYRKGSTGGRKASSGSTTEIWVMRGRTAASGREGNWSANGSPTGITVPATERIPVTP